MLISFFCFNCFYFRNCADKKLVVHFEDIFLNILNIRRNLELIKFLITLSKQNGTWFNFEVGKLKYCPILTLAEDVNTSANISKVKDKIDFRVFCMEL